MTGFREDSLKAIQRMMQQGVDAVRNKPIDIDGRLKVLSG
jgi:hypothetical protein